jgi:hypothetical protein
VTKEMKRLKPGDFVCNRYDPRHVGVVYQTSTDGQQMFASVQWCSTGWKESRVPARHLKRADRALASGSYSGE